MSKRNVKKTIEGSRCLVNDYYDITVNDLIEISEISETKIDAIANGFLFGYVLGSRAERVRQKNKTVEEQSKITFKRSESSREAVEK